MELKEREKKRERKKRARSRNIGNDTIHRTGNVGRETDDREDNSRGNGEQIRRNRKTTLPKKMPLSNWKKLKRK